MRKAAFFLSSISLIMLATDALATSAEDWRKFKKIIYEFENARYEGWSDQKALADIAKRIKLPEEETRTIFENGKSGNQALREDVMQKVVERLDATELKGTYSPISLKGRISDIKLDTAHSHFVAYVTWKAAAKLTTEEEACLIAFVFGKEFDLFDTLSMAAVDETGEKTVFSAKISIEGAKKITKERIVDFADKRYIKLFEDVVIK